MDWSVNAKYGIYVIVVGDTMNSEAVFVEEKRRQLYISICITYKIG